MSELVWELLVCRACYNVLFQVCVTTSGKVEECGERLVATIKDSQTTIVAEKTTKLCNFVQVLILVQVPFTYMICVPLHALMAKITNE